MSTTFKGKMQNVRWGGSCRDHDDTGREDRGSGGFHFHKKYRKLEKDT